MRAASIAVQLGGGLLLAPLLPGLVQHWKARLQGRRGPTPLQPYRELRRLWGKSAVDVVGAGAVYRVTPALVAACAAIAVLLVPVTSSAPRLAVGNDMLALAGVLALARCAVGLAAWDTGHAFSLMGASRELMIAVAVEVTFVLALAVAALVAGTTSLAAIVGATAGLGAWSSPAIGLGAVAFALVIVAETGRQPVDGPDSHLELTMIHHGPQLEYAGRDLAFLQWSVAARHWIVLVLAAQIFVPHAHGAWWQLAVLPLDLAALCGALAIVETLTAKLRILLVPRLLGVGALAALLGIVSWLVQTP